MKHFFYEDADIDQHASEAVKVGLYRNDKHIQDILYCGETDHTIYEYYRYQDGDESISHWSKEDGFSVGIHRSALR